MQNRHPSEKNNALDPRTVVTRTISKAHQTASDLKVGGTLALVPTMGALHDGHLELVRSAKRNAKAVAVSIFVNPLQFGRNEDLESYPTNIARDIALLKTEGVDLIFIPGSEQFLKQGSLTRVSVDGLDDVLCGKYRPGHFTGVATIVTKLFNVTQPDIAIFGLKDFQQFQIIKKMTADLDIPIKLIGVPTVRERNGLALSSRNARLSAAGRDAALVIPQAIEIAKKLVKSGELDAKKITQTVKKNFVNSAGEARTRRDNVAVQLQYLELVDPGTLRSVRTIAQSGTLLAIAAFVENVRLIDSCILKGRP